MTSIRRISLIAICFCVLFAKTGVAQVVGFSGVLESTTANEIDGWSETDIDYDTAYFYNAAVIGYLYEGQTQRDVELSETDYLDPCNPMDWRCDGNPIPPPIVFAGVETNAPVHQGSVYTVFSEHYLEAYWYYQDVGYYNPSYYSPGSYFTSPGGGDPSGTGYESGGGLQYVQEEIIYLGYTYFQFSTAPPSISQISPKSNFRGTSGTIHVQGQSLKDDLGRIGASFRDSDISANVNVNTADASQADVSYSISSTASIGNHQLVMSNTWGESEPATFTVPYPPATITGISPNTWTAGQSYTGVQITGTNFGTAPIVTLSDPTINVSAPYNTSSTSGASTTHVNLYIPPTTPSEPVVVTLTPGPYTQVSGGPPLPASGSATVIGAQQAVCPAMLDSNSGFSDIASTGIAPGGGGTMTVLFSSGSFSGNSVTVPYGPYSTPESIASHLAALITKQYYRLGLSAQAIGSEILYKSTATLGTTSFTTAGSSFTATGAPVSCPKLNLAYVLAVTGDSVGTWVSNGDQRGREIIYTLKRWPSPTQILTHTVSGLKPSFSSAAITEHLYNSCDSTENGYSSSNTISPGSPERGVFDDIIGLRGLGSINMRGTCSKNRYFDVVLTNQDLSQTNLGRVTTYDKTAVQFSDHLVITAPNGPSIVNDYKNSDGSPKDLTIGLVY